MFIYRTCRLGKRGRVHRTPLHFPFQLLSKAHSMVLHCRDRRPTLGRVRRLVYVWWYAGHTYLYSYYVMAIKTYQLCVFHVHQGSANSNMTPILL